VLRIHKANFFDAQDAQWIPRLIDEHARDPMGGGFPIEPMILEKIINGLKACPSAHAFLAKVDDEKPAGLLICYQVFSTFKAAPVVNIHDLIVAESARGMGVGKGLLTTVEDYARSIGACKLTLEVRQDNEPALGLYRKAGFYDYQLGDQDVPMLFWEKPL
jgi:ribosomal protein S18 acetylase RimI-like enzyme